MTGRKRIRANPVVVCPRCRGYLELQLQGEEYPFKDKGLPIIYCPTCQAEITILEQAIAEIRRIAKMQAVIYIGSVIKKQWAIYKYKNRHGRFALDPTHEREYRSLEEFRDLLQVGGLEIIRIRQTPVMRKILKMNVRIPGFYIVEVVCKNEGY